MVACKNHHQHRLQKKKNNSKQQRYRCRHPAAVSIGARRGRKTIRRKYHTITFDVYNVYFICIRMCINRRRETRRLADDEHPAVVWRDRRKSKPNTTSDVGERTSERARGARPVTARRITGTILNRRRRSLFRKTTPAAVVVATDPTRAKPRRVLLYVVWRTVVGASTHRKRKDAVRLERRTWRMLTISCTSVIRATSRPSAFETGHDLISDARTTRREACHSVGHSRAVMEKS